VAVQATCLGLHSDLFVESEDVSVHHVASEDIIDVLNSSIYTNASQDEQDQSAECYDCIILNTEDILELTHILEFMTASAEYITRRPRVILLSRLLSWGGKKYKVPIGTSISEFNARNPYLTEEGLYKVENKFQTCAALTKMEMCIVGVGMIYGSSGFDFKDLCKDLFIAEAGAESVIFSAAAGANTVPMIHHADLVQILEHLSTSPAAFPNFFIPAVDFSTATLKSVFEALSKSSGRTVRCTTEAEALEVVMNSTCDNTHHRWDLDLSFSDSHKLPDVELKYPNGMIDSTDEVWGQFRYQSCSQPCSILVAGPPSSLKTTLAKDLSSTLGIKYIDWVTSVKNCLEKFVEKKSNVTDGMEEKKEGDSVVTGEEGTIDLTQVDDAHVALRMEIERCIRVSKKMKDDAVLEISDIVFDKVLLGILPKNLVAEAIAAQILLDEQCQKRGYVLDIWGLEEKIIVGKHQLYEVTNTRPPIPKETPPNPEEKTENGGEVVGGEEQSLESMDSYQYKPTSTEDKRPQLIVELQCDTATCIKQFLTPLGVIQTEGAKLSKDQQALVKDIETRTADYEKLLKPFNTAEQEETPEGTEEKTANDDESTPAYSKLSHPVVQQCEADGYSVMRVDVNNMPPVVPPEGTVTEKEKEKEPEKGKTPRTARTDKSSESKTPAPEPEVEVSPPEPVDPTKALIEEIYENYAGIYGPLDWVKLEVKSLLPTVNAEALDIDVTQPFEQCDGFDMNNLQDDEDEDELKEQPLSAPPNRIEELNATLQALGPMMCSILRPSSDKLNTYLVENVLSHVAEALVLIHRDKVDDPMAFMADFLRKRGEDLEVTETKNAHEKYFAAVREAELLEEEAAMQLQEAVESSCDEWED